MSIIEDCVSHAQLDGLRVVRGPIFIWGKNNVLIAVDCWGAVLYAHNKAHNPLPNGWLKDLCDNLIQKNSFWWWRYNYGFSQGRSLELYREVNNVKTFFEDDVSKEAAHYARKLGLYS